MNSWLFRTFKFAALTAIGGTALMQAEQATFHLPVEAHWGQTVLKPGDYKMILPDDAIGHHDFKIEGEGKTVYVQPMVWDATDISNSSHLELKEIDGEYFVRGFLSGVSGKEFTFYTPKRVHRQEASKGVNKAGA